MKSTCSPIIQTSNNKKKKHTLKKAAFNNTCFSKEDLYKIIKDWNIFNPKNKFVINNILSLSSKNLWDIIENKLTTTTCNNEYCWVKKRVSPQLSQKLKYNFRPEMPSTWHKNNLEWLSTSDIEDVIKQYEDEFNNFTFRGAVPLDFDKILSKRICVSNDVCYMNLNKLKKNGKTKIGIVFNMDEHTKSGSHWVAMFIDLDNMILGFWDSYGIEPPQEVITLINRLQKQSNKYWKRPLIITHNKKRHQYKTSECGMYCIYFITQLLEGYTLNYVYNNIINDDQMNHKRHIYFSKIQ